MGAYLDYNASTPVDERVLEKMTDIYRNHFGNADSRTHRFGSDAKSIVEDARMKVARLLGTADEFVFFTSGSTESNNMAVLGLEEYGIRSGKRHIVTTAIEHKSILEPCRHLEKKGFEIEYVLPHEDGRVHAEDVLGRVRPDTLLVSVMHVNNETGTIQPVEEIGKALEGTEVYFHIDASQSCGKLVEELRRLRYDLLSGGGQERGMRPGTLPAALIGGMGEAAAILEKEYLADREKCGENRRMIFEVLRESGVRFRINGDPALSLNNTLNISFDGYDSEALMLAMEMEGLGGISNGSACTSHSYEPSYVLRAMGLDDERISCAVRISWGREPVDRQAVAGMTELVKAWQGE